MDKQNSDQKTNAVKIILFLAIFLLILLTAGMVWGFFDPSYTHMPQFLRQLFNSLLIIPPIR